MQKLELLAPAKDLTTGIAAIDCGADAVYVGPARFGARAAAGNSIEDIGRLCSYAHRFGAKVYATVNTLFRDEELPEAVALTEQLHAVGVDALLIQDFRLLQMSLPSIAIHASTQCDNRTADDVLRLYRCGIRRAVLARELTLEEIKTIRNAVPHDMELEVFVHGAICVSYSGCCYASEHCFQRSANRGECAQFCRLRFALQNEKGEPIAPEAHYLSMKDMCRLQDLEALAEAGVTSFKIEGRLKNADYVKNVVSAYHQRLNQLVANQPQLYCRASLGEVQSTFVPDLQRTFNRGYSDYFLHHRRSSDMWSPHTPKAIGQTVGTVGQVGKHSIEIQSATPIANGDGLCFFNDDHILVGFRVNRVENRTLYPYRMPQGIRRGMPLYRTQDTAFEHTIATADIRRRLPIALHIAPSPDGYCLTAAYSLPDGERKEVGIRYGFSHQEARQPQHDNIVRQLSRWGNTAFVCQEVAVAEEMRSHFLPSSTLSDMRRQLADRLEAVLAHEASASSHEASALSSVSESPDDSHQRAEAIAESIRRMPPSYRQCPPGTPLMQCRFCLRRAMGNCNPGATGEPLYLVLPDGRRFRAAFDCKQCQMNIYAQP